MEQKQLSELTEQELQTELKKRKQMQIFGALAIGFSIGVFIWSATHKGSFWIMLFPIIVIYVFRNTSDELKAVKKEIENRKNL
jgi:uncharacterized membrane protein